MATRAIQFGASDQIPRMLGEMIDQIFDDPGKRDQFIEKMNEHGLGLEDFEAALPFLADVAPPGSAFYQGDRFADAATSFRSLEADRQDFLRQSYLSRLRNYRASQTAGAKWDVSNVEYCNVGPSDSRRFKVSLQSGGSNEFIFVDIGEARYDELREEILQASPALPAQSVPMEIRGPVRFFVEQLSETLGSFRSGESINWD
jgi:hypothetical protein